MSWLMAERRGAAVHFLPGTASPYVGVGHIPVGWVLEKVSVIGLYNGIAADDRFGLGLIGVGSADASAWDSATLLYTSGSSGVQTQLDGRPTLPFRISTAFMHTVELEPYVFATSGPMMVIMAVEPNSNRYVWLLQIVFGRPLDVEGMIRAGFERLESGLRGA